MPPFSTKEPERYQAARIVTTVEYRNGAADSAPETVITKVLIARDGEKRREEYNSAGNTRHFALLKKFLTTDAGDKACAREAEELNAHAGSIAATVLRMRQRYRELVRAEIADTVAGTGDIDDETRWLVAALS